MRFANAMKRKTLLFLSAVECCVYSWQDGKLSDAICFSDDVRERQLFTAFMQANSAPVLLLTDLIEEDFRQEIVPHLRGGERTALIRRKLVQYYRDTPFRQALCLPRSNEERDDEMLFSALTNPALITPWLDIMLAQNTPLRGIYSIPNICTVLLEHIPASKLLLLSWEKHAGLRQTYFDAHRLHFSRLTPIHDSCKLGATIRMEAARSLQYLRNLSRLNSGQILEVHIICHAHDRCALEAQLIDEADLHYAYLDIRELAQRIGVNADFADSDATPLFLHLLAAHPPPHSYATSEHTHFNRMRLIRRVLFGLSTTLATGCLLWSAANIMQAVTQNQASFKLKAQTGELSRQTRQIIQNFPDTLASASDMKTAVMVSHKLDNRALPPQQLLQALSNTLDSFPSIRLDKLSWNTAAAGDDERVLERVILLDGELDKFAGDYRGMFKYLQQFQQALTQDGYQVTVQALPLDVSPQGSIDTDTGLDNTEAAKFSLKLILRTAV